MAVNIIDNLLLGSDLPLDARYRVDSIYDVSLYWYDGMQMWEPSTNRLWVVKDVSTEQIEPVLFDYDILSGGTNWITPTTDSVSGGSW